MIDINSIINIFKLKRPKLVGRNLMASCPFASETHVGGTDNNRSFGINIDTLQYNCYTCHAKGDTIRTLATKLGILLPDDFMLEVLANAYDNLSNIKLKEQEKIFYDRSIIDKFINEYNMAYKMLKHRGISLAAIKRFNVGYNPNNKSVLFPIFNSEGKLLGWNERNETWENRYAFRPDGVVRKHFLFGLDRKIKDCYLVEGPIDQLKLTSWYIEAVATCGDIIFKEQAEELLENCENIILVRDMDLSGKLWLKDAKKYLKGKIPLFQIEVSEYYKDVGHKDMTKDIFMSYKKELIL